MRQRWQVVREQAQQEQRARVQAQAERDDLAGALREEKAARVRAEEDCRVREGKLAAQEKSHRTLQQRTDDLQKELSKSQVSGCASAALLLCCPWLRRVSITSCSFLNRLPSVPPPQSA